MSTRIRQLVFGAVGFGGGFAYATFVGCHFTWGITSNPWVTGLFGLAIAASFVSGAESQPQPQAPEE